jgi:hypothetical protein
MAARRKLERRRDRAGAICSSFLNVSSSTSTSNCFIGSFIGKRRTGHNVYEALEQPRSKKFQVVTESIQNVMTIYAALEDATTA